MRKFIDIVAATQKNPLMEDAGSSSNFMAWFRNSKVVDDDGNPLVCYHGTTNDFHEFYPGSHFGDKDAANDRLSYLKIEPKLLSGHKGAIMPVYLRIENPLRIEDDGGLRDGYDIADAVRKAGALTPEEYTALTAPRLGVSKRALFKLLTGKGYDGLVYRNVVEGSGDSWIPFWPQQVKSIWNKGSFSNFSNHISEDDNT